MPPVGLEPATPASDRPQTLVLDGSAENVKDPVRNRTRYLPYCSTSTKCDTAFRRFEPRTLRTVAPHYTYCKGKQLIKCGHCTEIPHASHTRSDRGENSATLSKLIWSEFWSWS
jgi:hypothetical protein